MKESKRDEQLNKALLVEEVERLVARELRRSSLKTTERECALNRSDSEEVKLN